MILYAAMRYLDLAKHLSLGGKPVKKLDNSEAVGFLPVYRSLEDLKAENPGLEGYLRIDTDAAEIRAAAKETT
jgi:hypothetical protein